MRVILAFTTSLALASSAAAQTVPDRYGPARPVVMAAATTPAAVYGGRMLSWSSKAAPVAEAAPVAQPQAAPIQPPRAERQPAQPDLMSRAYTLGAVERPAPSPARPTSLYDSPAPQPAARQAYAPQPVAPQPSYAPQPAPIAQQSAPAPRQIAPAPAAAPQPPAAPMRMAAAPLTPPGGGAPVRLYSLHREYGMTPDPTPQVPKGEHYVLIGPPDTAQPNPDTDAEAAKADDGPARPF